MVKHKLTDTEKLIFVILFFVIVWSLYNQYPNLAHSSNIDSSSKISDSAYLKLGDGVYLKKGTYDLLQKEYEHYIVRDSEGYIFGQVEFAGCVILEENLYKKNGKYQKDFFINNVTHFTGGSEYEVHLTDAINKCMDDKNGWFHSHPQNAESSFSVPDVWFFLADALRYNGTNGYKFNRLDLIMTRPDTFGYMHMMDYNNSIKPDYQEYYAKDSKLQAFNVARHEVHVELKDFKRCFIAKYPFKKIYCSNNTQEYIW